MAESSIESQAILGHCINKVKKPQTQFPKHSSSPIAPSRRTEICNHGADLMGILGN